MLQSPSFPCETLLNSPDRSRQLLQSYYEDHHKNRSYHVAKDAGKKFEFFQREFRRRERTVRSGIDLGCRGAALTVKLAEFGSWVGVDIDELAIRQAELNGIPCIQSDISIALDFHDDSFDAVAMTEVLEHLPYPLITLREVHRILEKKPESVFIGTVPVDYHLHRRFAVFRGQRLNDDPTHLHSFSFDELKAMLDHFFEHVTFEPLHGTKTRHAWLPWTHFVSDVAWFATSPRRQIDDLPVKIFP